MNYFDSLIEAMSLLAKQPNLLITGQTTRRGGAAIYNTLKHLPETQRIEYPVAENMQIGHSIGLSLEGFLVLSVIPRFNFLFSGMDQMVSHLDKLHIISQGEWTPKVIVRTSIGSTKPLDPQIQHCGDFTEAFNLLLPNMNVVRLDKTEDIVPAYQKAIDIDKSSLLIEWARKYNE